MAMDGKTRNELIVLVATLVQAARVLASQLEPSLNYEYYALPSEAQRVADAMSVVTGKRWIVRRNAPCNYSVAAWRT